MGSVQPFLEGSFRSERARGFGSIQSEAVTRVGRIRSLEEVRKSVSTIGRRVIISSEPKGSSGYEGGTALPKRQVLLVGVCFRIFQDPQ